mgnify:CR=1 FL=1
MKKATYTIGEESLQEWESKNGSPAYIVLTGNVSADTFTQLAKEFDYTKYQRISFENLAISDNKYDNGATRSFEEELYSYMTENGEKLHVLLKLFLNSHYTKDFVVADNCVFSDDWKTLVHIPEARSVVIPSHVEHIGVATCCGYDMMSTIKLNQGLKSIDKGAFISAGIAQLDMPDSVVELGEDAFLMSDLEKVRLSNSLVSIPNGCFSLCLIEEIYLPSSLKTIGTEALKGLWIDEIDIPEGVERIDYDAFEAMRRVSLPSTLKEIAPDFYYEECIDNPQDVPYITVHPDNKTFVSIDGSLYFRDSGELALDAKYNDSEYFD